MTPSRNPHLAHALALTLPFLSLATPASAQGFPSYGQNSRSFGITHENIKIQTSQDIGKNVYLIDNLADQMLYRLTWDLKLNSQSRSEDALLKQMKGHAELTNELINAYRGRGNSSFQEAAISVNKSIMALLELKRDSKTSEVVSQMISQSLPLITFINQNAHLYSSDSKT